MHALGIRRSEAVSAEIVRPASDRAVRERARPTDSGQLRDHSGSGGKLIYSAGRGRILGHVEDRWRWVAMVSVVGSELFRGGAICASAGVAPTITGISMLRGEWISKCKRRASNAWPVSVCPFGDG